LSQGFPRHIREKSQISHSCLIGSLFFSILPIPSLPVRVLRPVVFLFLAFSRRFLLTPLSSRSRIFRQGMLSICRPFFSILLRLFFRLSCRFLPSLLRSRQKVFFFFPTRVLRDSQISPRSATLLSDLPAVPDFWQDDEVFGMRRGLAAFLPLTLRCRRGSRLPSKLTAISVALLPEIFATLFYRFFHPARCALSFLASFHLIPNFALFFQIPSTAALFLFQPAISPPIPRYLPFCHVRVHPDLLFFF